MAHITDTPIDTRPAVDAVRAPAAGAVLTFCGVVRDHHAGQTVTGIDYHAYRPMAVRELDRIEAAARDRWPDIGIHIVHRIGQLEIGDASVFIAVSSPHREEGFAALRFAIEEIKRSVPIWKKELYPDGHAWIEGS